MQWIRKLKSTRFISEIDDERVLHDEVDVVRDEWAEREETVEDVECQEEAVDCLLGRGRWPALITPVISVRWGGGGNVGDRGSSGSLRSFSRGGLGIHTSVCSSFQVLYLRPVATNCSNIWNRPSIVSSEHRRDP